MNLYVKKIRLAQIRLETDFRSKEKDLSLEMSLQRHGLQEPLVVEMEDQQRYVLVDGYRRFYALDFLGVQWADCVVETETSSEERAVRRLRQELHGGKERKTAYHLDKMVQWLAETGSYDPLLLARLCSVRLEVILKYIPGVRSRSSQVGERSLSLQEGNPSLSPQDNGAGAKTAARLEDLYEEDWQPEDVSNSVYMYNPVMYGSLYSASALISSSMNNPVSTPMSPSPYSPIPPISASVYNPMIIPMSYSLFDPLNSTNPTNDLALKRLAEMDKILGEVYFY